MPQDVRELTDFYHTPLGQMARRVIRRRIRNFWPNMRGRRLLGYGYAVPYLDAFGDAERAIAAMPSHLGVIGWPDEKNAALLCEEDCLPFPDVFFDRILIVHGLEGAESLRPLLPGSLPAAHSPGQMPLAQALLLDRLGLAAAALEGGFTD
jgi:hypothetical protein